MPVQDVMTTPPTPQETAATLIAAALSVAGSAVAGTLWWAHRSNIELPCTGDGRGCDLVAASRWAHLSLGPLHDIPLALLGFLAYLGLLTLCLALLGAETPRMRLALRRMLRAATVIGLCYSWYLQYVAHFKIGAFCVWCFSSATIMTALFATVTWGMRTRNHPVEIEANSQSSPREDAKEARP